MPPTHQALMESPLSLGAPAERPAALRAFLDEGRKILRAAHDEGAAGRTIVRAWSRLVAKGVIALFDAAHRDAGGPPGAALAGIGGFGRLDLAPFSDVDVLLVHDPAARVEVQPIAESLFTALWDAKLEVGATVRTPEECAESAAADHTIRTALLDCKYLAGDRDVYQDLENRVLRDLSEAQVDELVAAKVEEMHRRRERYGGSVHLLEPSVKQSPGGLRDLQAALWMARARFKAAGLSDLLARGILPRREVEELSKARDFLWRLRNQLHHLAGRKEDHLTFHRQEQVAAALGYLDREGEGLAVEQFMRDYYLAASRLRRFADELAERCAPARPEALHAEPRQVAPGLVERGGRLALEGREALRRDPSLFVRLFTAAERLGAGIEASTRDLVRDEAAQLDPAIRSHPAVCAALVEALARPGRADWLRAMHREGVLGALVPEFGRITAKHQHDLYHVYTVDTHSIMAVQRLAGLLAGDLLEEEPALSLAAREIPRPLGLVLGVLFHDAGKGLGGDHSARGAELVRSVAARLGVAERDAANAEFLVREHLAMSHVSQRRDLSDPELIEEFARRVGDRERLDMLYVLTF
ncbi:MAG TPA: [protein-PII] uridylyltransferase, partial [Vulgatibacter sp.]|nr:[protein-PII] uridylyltransferase [Vulgatibacter sp.]